MGPGSGWGECERQVLGRGAVSVGVEVAVSAGVSVNVLIAVGVPPEVGVSVDPVDVSVGVRVAPGILGDTSKDS